MAKSSNHPMMPRWEAVIDEEKPSTRPLIIAGVLVVLVSAGVSILALEQTRPGDPEAVHVALQRDSANGDAATEPPADATFIPATDSTTGASITARRITENIAAVGSPPSDVVARGSYTAVNVTVKNSSPDRLNIAGHHFVARATAGELPLAITPMTADSTNDYGWQSPLPAGAERSLRLYFDVPDGDTIHALIYYPNGGDFPLLIKVR